LPTIAEKYPQFSAKPNFADKNAPPRLPQAARPYVDATLRGEARAILNRRKNALKKQRLFANIIKMPLFRTKNKGIMLQKG
jgi:hypothetical protein